MVKEIRELDSGMRELVYENYNKFISPRIQSAP